MKIIYSKNSRIKKLFINIIIWYQNYISSRVKRLGIRCRFYPSCSHYSIQALTKYGLFHGLLKTIWRLLRCNPFNQSDYIDFP